MPDAPPSGGAPGGGLPGSGLGAPGCAGPAVPELHAARVRQTATAQLDGRFMTRFT
jgi:hypothetical protein